MAVTYGEAMLAKAEARARSRSARRRRVLLLAPSVAIAGWALVDQIGAANGRLSQEGASAPGHLIAYAQAVAWVLCLVIVPIAMAVRPRPVPAAAAVALASGPVFGPVFFEGGWSWWQRTCLAAICVLILLAARTRRR